MISQKLKNLNNKNNYTKKLTEKDYLKIYNFDEHKTKQKTEPNLHELY